MNVIVCIKQVPDTETRVRVGADGKSIDETDVSFVLNPYDEYAVEEALRLKEKHGGTVTLISLGPSGASTAIRTALAMGADDAVHLVVEKSRMRDSTTVARALWEEIKDREFQIILCGKKAIDIDNGQVPVILAEFLNIPCVTGVILLEIDDQKAKASREIEGGKEIVEVDLPAVFSAEKDLNEPRYASLKGIMLAKRKTIEEKTPVMEKDNLVVTKMELPPPPAQGRIVGEGPDAVPELVRLLKEEAKVI